MGAAGPGKKPDLAFACSSASLLGLDPFHQTFSPHKHPPKTGRPPGTRNRQQPVSPARNDVYFHTESKEGGGRMHSWASAKQPGRGGGLGGDKNPGGHVGPCPHVPFPAAGRLLPRARPARDVFGSTKRGVRGRQGAEGGSLSYKTRSQQALRNKSRVPEQPAPPPRTDRRWEGGGCSQRAGRAAPPMAGAGGRPRVSPHPVQNKYRLPGAAPGAERSRGGGKWWWGG